jgi:transcriptional regulator with XRE-family HTH domain
MRQRTLKLYELFRFVREMQNFPQKNVASAAGISPSALARFEKGDSSLSAKTINSLANILNLDPSLFEFDHAQPFIQSDSDKPISFFLRHDFDHSEIDILFDMILADYNSHDIILLKLADLPSAMDRKKIAKYRRKGLTIAAFVMRSQRTGNTFLFRPHKLLTFFKEEELKYFLYDRVPSAHLQYAMISSDLYEKIQDPSDISVSYLMSQLKIEQENARQLVNWITDRIAALGWTKKDRSHRDKLLYAFKKVENKIDGDRADVIINNLRDVLFQHFEMIGRMRTKKSPGENAEPVQLAAFKPQKKA